jgi:hypothetical protein
LALIKTSVALGTIWRRDFPSWTKAIDRSECVPTTCSAPGVWDWCHETFRTTTTPTISFKALGDLAVTGPTLTNVNDFRAILIL